MAAAFANGASGFLRCGEGLRFRGGRQTVSVSAPRRQISFLGPCGGKRRFGVVGSRSPRVIHVKSVTNVLLG